MSNQGTLWVRWVNRITGKDDVREVVDGELGPEIVYHFQKGGPGGRPPDYSPRTHDEVSREANLQTIIASVPAESNEHLDVAGRLASIDQIALEMLGAAVTLRRHAAALAAELRAGGAP